MLLRNLIPTTTDNLSVPPESTEPIPETKMAEEGIRPMEVTFSAAVFACGKTI